MGQQSANKSAERIANTPQTSASSSQGQSTFAPTGMASPMYGMLGGIGNQMGQTPTPYFPGQGYVGPSAPTQAGMNMGMGSLDQYGQAAQASAAAAPWMTGALGQALGNYGFLSNAANVGQNPYVQDMMGQNARLLNRNFNEQLMPAIQDSSVGVNALGSSRQGIAQGLAARGTQEGISDANERLLLGAYGQGLGAQQSALGQTNSLLAGMLAPAGAMGAAGDYLNRGGQTGLDYGQVAEGYQQKALDDAMSRFQYQYAEPWNRTGQINGVLGALAPLGTQYNNSAGTGAQSGQMMPQSSPWVAAGQGAIGGGLLGYGMYNSGMFGNQSNGWLGSGTPQQQVGRYNTGMMAASPFYPSPYGGMQ
jgi:hypothetical protein